MFKFKGISSNDMQVIIEEEEHFIARASQRYEMTEIEGRDGAIFDALGYSVVERPIYVQCLNIEKIDDILAWLNGEGEFEYKGRKTIARFYSQLEPQRSACIRIIDATFIRDPFWSKSDDEFEIVKDRKDKKMTGENITITDSSNMQFEKFLISGNSWQETREGYNILNVPSVLNITSEEVNRLIDINIDADTKYTIKADKIETDSTKPTTILFRFIDSDNADISYVYLNLTDKHQTFSLNKNAVKVRIYSSSGHNASAETNTTFTNLMIYKGTDLTKPYEPYGAMPSPEFPSEIKNVTGNVNITVCNENIWNEEWELGSLNITTGEKVSTNACIRSAEYIPLKPNTTYYFKTAYSEMCFYDKDKKFISSTAKANQTFTTDANTRYLLFRNTTAYGTTYNNDIMIAESDIEVPYQPHQSQTFTFPLSEGQVLYKDDYLADDGIHHSRKQIVLDGSDDEGWTINQELDEYISFYLGVEPYTLITPDKFCYCSHFETMYVWGVVSSLNAEYLWKHSKTSMGIKIKKSRLTSINVVGFKAWLSENPIKIEYELAEEEIEPYTAEQQEVYDKIKELCSYKNITHIYSTDEISPVFEVTYIKETNEKILNAGNIQSRPILKLEKTISDSVELTINNVRFKYNFNGDKYVEIDCEEKTTKYENLNRSRQIEIGYEFPKLEIGNNNIIMHTGDCIIQAKRKDRWL